MARLIDADKIHPDIRTQKGMLGISQGQLAYAPTINAIPIPEGATNGDMLKALFPCLEKYEYEELYIHGIALAGNDDRVTWFANEWWNAPYKSEGSGEE